MRKESRGLLLYLLIAFGWSWLGWLPSVIISVTDNTRLMYWMGEGDVAGNPRLWPLVVVGVLASFGPSAAAFIVTGIIEGKAGVRSLWQRFLKVESAAPWLLAAVLLPFLIVSVPRLIVIPLGYPIRPGWLVQPALIIGWLLNDLTRSGGLSEEFGWRGFALPRLQARFKALWSSVILGVIWALWHIPLWFIAGQAQRGTTFWLFLANLILLSILYGWLVNSARGNVLVAVLFHGFLNTAARMFPDPTANLFYWIVLAAAVVLVVTIAGPRNLARRSDKVPEDDPSGTAE